MPSPLSPHIRSFTPPSFALNRSLTTTTTMSYNAPTPSSPSSLTSSIVDDTSRPSSTRPEAGWGSPSPVPDSFPPISLATIPTPIHSVTIPLYAHTLRDDFPDSQDIKKLSDYLRSPAFALSIDSFLDISSPLYALRRAYLKNSHLRLMSTNISPSPQQTVLSRLIREVYLEIEGSLVMVMYQLGMLKFLEDIDRYMLELSRRNSPDSSSSFVTALSTHTSSSNITASSSPLMSDEERVLQRVESWWTGGNSQVPLPSTHLRYHQACHSCHRLGHYRNQCPVYQCPHCTRWAPGHNPNRCPLHRQTPHSSSSSSPTISRRSSGSSRRSPVPTPPPRRSHSPYPWPWHPRNRNRSPISNQDDIDVYEDISGDGIIDSVGWSNITGSPCGSESGYF